MAVYTNRTIKRYLKSHDVIVKTPYIPLFFALDERKTVSLKRENYRVPTFLGSPISRIAYLFKQSGIKRLVVLTFIFVLISSLAQAQTHKRLDDSTQAVPAIDLSDTLLLDYSLEELLEIRGFYQKEADNLLQQRERLREIGIHDLETFLAASPFNPDMDKIIIRLADLNYEQAQKDYGLAMDKFNSTCCEDENTPKTFGDSLAPQPELDYSRSLELYLGHC